MVFFFRWSYLLFQIVNFYLNPPKSQGLWDVVKYTVGIFQNAAFIEVHTFLTEIKYKLQFLFVQIRLIFIGCSFALILIIKSNQIVLFLNLIFAFVKI